MYTEDFVHIYRLFNKRLFTPSYFIMLSLMSHVKTCKRAVTGKITYLSSSRAGFWLLGSPVLGEGEEHVTRRDQDPPRAPWALLQPAAGKHASTAAWLLKRITCANSTRGGAEWVGCCCNFRDFKTQRVVFGVQRRGLFQWPNYV